MLGTHRRRFVAEAGRVSPSSVVCYVTLLTSVLACFSCGKVTIGVGTTLPAAATPSVVRPAAKQSALLALTKLIERLESRHGVRLLDPQGQPLVLATLDGAQIEALKNAIEAVLRAPEGTQEVREALRALEEDAQAFGALAARVSKATKMEGGIVPAPPTPDFAAGGFSCEAAPILGRAGEARVFPCALSRPEAASGIVFRWAGTRPAACPDLVVSDGHVGAVLGSGPACTGTIEACDAAGLCVASTNPVTIAGVAIATSIGTPTLTPQCRVEFPATRSISGPIVGATGLQTFSGVDLAPHATASGYSLPVSHATAPGDFRIDFGYSGATFEGRPVSERGFTTRATRDVRLSQSVALLPLRQATSAESASTGGITGNLTHFDLPTNECVTCGSDGNAQIAAGSDSVCLKSSTGEVSCWGENDSGQLGDGSTQDSLLPRKVSLPAPARRVTLAKKRVCAVLETDELWCWGFNSDGFLDGGATTSHVLSPKKVQALGSTVLTASAGAEHLCAILRDGTLKCWGRGAYGRLGLGDTADRLLPTTVPIINSQGIPLPVADVTAGSANQDNSTQTCAVSRAGAAYCWGANWAGALGDGTDVHRFTPTPVTGLGSGVVQMATSSYFSSCALKSDGKAYCWGDFAAWSQWVPTEVPGVSNVVSITGAPLPSGGGDTFVCALDSFGEVKCWGYDSNGIYPLAKAGGSELPTTLAFPEPLRALSAGGGFVCGVGRSGQVYCVGRNGLGSKGDGRAVKDIPPTVMHPGRSWDRIFALSDFSCGATGTQLWCWGSASDGKLGSSANEATFEPVLLGDFGSPVTNMGSAQSYACALTQDGKVWCWGSNWSGKLGRGSASTAILDPAQVASLPAASALVVGSDHACAIASGKAYCWGDNSSGQLGKGDRINASSPVEITALGSDVIAMAVTINATCALRSGSGQVACAGLRNMVGIGDATFAYQLTPTTPTGLGTGVSGLHGNGEAFCAVRSGNVLCWGRNYVRQAGIPTGSNILSPTTVALPGSSPTFVPTSDGGSTCIRTVAGDGSPLHSCWGRTVVTSTGVVRDSIPVPSTIGTFAFPTFGSRHACGLLGADWKCWGTQTDEGGDVAFPIITAIPLSYEPVPVADPTAPSSTLKAFFQECFRWALSLLP